MRINLKQAKWEIFLKRKALLLYFGIKTGLVNLYDDELIEKLRDVYYGGIPASITLLCLKLTNGHCYDRATLMSQAFLDGDEDVKLIYADVDSLKLNPQEDSDISRSADHCVVERTTNDGRHLIYDTSVGLVYDKRLYWLIERPKVRRVNSKDAIIQFVNGEGGYHGDLEKDKYVAILTLPFIENALEGEIYAFPGLEVLQREIEIYKKKIGYDEMVAKRNRHKKEVEMAEKKAGVVI